MSTNKKITQLDELTPATWADDDVIAIVDISAQETKKIQLSTFRTAVGGVTTLTATTPLTVDTSLGDVTISVAISGGGTVNAVLDEDNMASNSPTALSTQQSIKAYVDSQIITVDSLSEVLALGNTTGGTDIAISIGDKVTNFTSTGIDDNATSTAITIDGGENVGIGAVFPAEKIDVNGNIRIQGGSPRLKFYETDNATKTWQIGLGAGNFILADDLASTIPIVVNQGAPSSSLVISSAGRVGVGTASPTQALEVAGTIRSSISSALSSYIATTSGGGSFFIEPDDYSAANPVWEIRTNASEPLAFQMGGAESMRITSAGFVGIGTTAPAQDLHVVGKARIQRSINATLEITSDNNTGPNPFAIGSDSDLFSIKNQAASGLGTGGNFIEYDEGGSLRLMGTNYITSAGNVGIGTSSPTDKLHVSGESFPNIRIETSSASSGDSTLDLVGYRTTNSPVGYLKFWNNATSPTELARVTSYREGADNTGNLLFYTSSGGSLGERMRIDSSGVVTVNEGSVVLNGSTISAVQVTIADDAVALLTFTNRRSGMLSVNEGADDDPFPDTASLYLGYVDFGTSALAPTAAQIGTVTAVDVTNTLTGTTGTNGWFTIGVAGVDGTLYLENRRGGARTFNVTLL